MVDLHLLAFDPYTEPIDFNILVCGNEQVLTTINNSCLDQVAMLRINGNRRISGLHLKVAAINQIGRVQRCSITKLGRAIITERKDLLLFHSIIV